MAGDIVDLDTLPAAVYKDYKDLFNKFLPGFSNTAEYNFQPGAYSKVAAEQTGVTVPSHSSYSATPLNYSMSDLVAVNLIYAN
jgi:hypothetical protein